MTNAPLESIVAQGNAEVNSRKATMVPEGPEHSSDATASSIREAISAFEQILEALPDDRLALETLWEAYAQVGDRSRALSYLMRLGRVVLKEGDAEAAPGIASKLLTLGHGVAEAEELAAKLRELAAPRAEEGPKRRVPDISAELNLAWRLVQAGLLSQEEYAAVANDLTEASMQTEAAPLSTLHLLAERGSKNMEQIMEFVASASGMPVIPLNQFDPYREAYSLLPLDFSLRSGAVVFERLDSDALVAVLNPFNAELQAQIQKTIGAPCHFFLTTPAAFTAFVTKIRQMEAHGTDSAIS